MKKRQIDQLLITLNYFNDLILKPASLTAVEMVLSSGKNKYKIAVGINEIDEIITYEVSLIGNKIFVKPDEFIDFIGQQASLYDCVEISLYERGGGRRITADDRNVKVANIDPILKKEQSGHFDKSNHLSNGVSEKRDYYIRVDEATAILKAIGIIDENNKVKNDKIRKYNQIDRFVELADPIIQEFIKRKETIYILDCACGKSYLSFVLNYYIREKLNHPCEFLGLDWSESVITSSKELAEQLHYTNMKFEQCDLTNYRSNDFIPTICMSLHACDTATDMAIYTGIMARSYAILCVPCCQKELLNSEYSFPILEKNILRHGLLKARFSDLMTDALRVLIMEANGYETAVIEYISPLDSPKNIMIKGRLSNKPNNESYKEYQSLKSQFNCEITLGRLLE